MIASIERTGTRINTPNECRMALASPCLKHSLRPSASAASSTCDAEPSAHCPSDRSLYVHRKCYQELSSLLTKPLRMPSIPSSIEGHDLPKLLNIAEKTVKAKTDNSQILDSSLEERIPKFENSGRYLLNLA